MQHNKHGISQAGGGAGFGGLEITWVLLCSLGAGGICALYLATSPLWTDELITLITVRRPFLEGLLQLQDYSPPLYQLLLRFFVSGDYPPAWVLRAPALFFAVLGLLASWWLARMLFGSQVAMLTTALLAVNPWLIKLAMNARPYTMFLFFSVLSMATFLRLVERRRFGDLAAYVVSTSLLLYSHYYGFLVLPAQVGFLTTHALFGRPDRRLLGRMTLAFATVGLIALPALWLASRFLQAGAPGTVGWLTRPILMDLYTQPGELLGSPILGGLAILALALAVWGTLPPRSPESAGLEPGRQANAATQWWAGGGGAWLCVPWVAISLYFLLAVSRFSRPVYHLRYSLPVMVPLTILTAAMICRLRVRTQILALILILFLVLPKTAMNFRPDKGFPQVVVWLQQADCDQSPVFVTHWSYCKGFVNPEAYGLRYYGFPETRINLLNIRYPYQPIILDPGVLPLDQRFFVLNFFGLGQSAIQQYLESRPRAYRTHHFGPLRVVEVEKEEVRARWYRPPE